jgi:RNA polymerase sigma-54 factor
MRQAQTLAPRQEQTLSPKMIAFYALLQMPVTDLEQHIAQQLNENPALEQDAERQCPVCGAPLTDSECACGFQASAEPVTEEDAGGRWEVLASAPLPSERASVEEDADDPFEWVEAPLSLQEHLRQQWGQMASGETRALGDILIGCINDEGYFDEDLSSLAEGLGVDVHRLEEVLAQVQQLEPVGVGARDARECALIQLRYLAEQGSGNKLAEKIVRDHWAALGRHSYEDIARRLRKSVKEVQAAADFIRERLNPYPGGASLRPNGQTTSAPMPGRVRPDVIIHRVKDKGKIRYEVEVVMSRAVGLRVNQVWQQQLRAMRLAPDQHSQHDRELVQQLVTQAREFLDNLNQRRRALKEIMECICEEQREFLEHGRRHLKPLTRLQIARKLGYHESTIGRAVAGKYALLPNGDVFHCEQFFDDSLAVKEVLKSIIAEEDPRHPYSDEQLVEQLKKKGIEIARRTVSKYREVLRIPSAAKRRRYDERQ